MTLSGAQEPIEIFHIEGRRSIRVVWLCEELGIPYVLTYKPDDIFGSMQTLRGANPLMPLSPTVRLGEQLVVESGAILDVLLARAGGNQFKPAVSSDDFVLHTQWMHFAEGTALARMLLWRFVATALEKDVDQLPQGHRANGDNMGPFTMAFLGAVFKVTQALGMGDKLTKLLPNSPIQAFKFLVGPRAIFDAIEQHLKRYPYFGGSQFTAADIMMHFPIRHSMLMCLIDLKDYPATLRWKNLVEWRAAFTRAEKACHPKGLNELGLPVGSPNPFPQRRAS
jgi:glutathione S-transferase